MSHNYLFDTYRFFQERLDHIKPHLTGAEEDQHSKAYAAGQIEALCDLERFLQERYEIKLPRRLRQQIQDERGVCTP